jgi:hypothetical protein
MGSAEDLNNDNFPDVPGKYVTQRVGTLVVDQGIVEAAGGASDHRLPANRYYLRALL